MKLFLNRDIIKFNKNSIFEKYISFAPFRKIYFQWIHQVFVCINAFCGLYQRCLHVSFVIFSLYAATSQWLPSMAPCSVAGCAIYCLLLVPAQYCKRRRIIKYSPALPAQLLLVLPSTWTLQLQLSPCCWATATSHSRGRFSHFTFN